MQAGVEVEGGIEVEAGVGRTGPFFLLVVPESEGNRRDAEINREREKLP